ncbi:hypothetical protein BUALT_Bualt02G0059600 [Buddleja alternifolia]|uniref:Tify domain-containing protein n=1 Tax=Buddleja alternifolia TaxID=168488 RepID=A0AAV6XZZ7_9LAMI|nr:hypothetical protein BUALT_Bualt02G0059600 [Buddleja alternifolia]
MDPLFLGADGSNVREKVTNEQFENDFLSISFNMEDQELGVSYGGIGNVVVNPFKDHVNRLHTSQDQSHSMESENTLEQPYGEKGENITLGHSTDIPDSNVRSMDSTSEGTDKNTCSKDNSNTVSLVDYQKTIIALLESPVSSYSLLYEQSSVLTSKTRSKIVRKLRASKFKLDSATKNKPETKAANKEAPNSVLTNVRSLTVTGMLDGVPVRYISSSREVVNAYEFESHAGRKTSHPNNHIYLENGKAMHQVVQELKNTPLSMLSEMDLPVGNSIVCTSQEKNTSFKLDTLSKCESETKAARKEEAKAARKEEAKAARRKAQNSFPSNVKCLLVTGMFDGVPVQYISSSREEALCGIIQGSGYLCGCQSCNYSKAVTAHEFECHADCSTHHPNNHIYFVNGKSIAQTVQELKSTPLSMLLDVIQTVAGFPINQKAFSVWKESFVAENRELQRVYGNEEISIQNENPIEI